MATLAGCGNTDSWVEAQPAPGWPAPYADSANSSYTATAGADALTLEWTRSTKGDIGASVAMSSSRYLAVNTQSSAGCSLMVWEVDNNARQRWCTRLWQGGDFAGALFDQFDNLYVGQPGAILSFPPTQWIRWRKPVIGMPLTPRIVEDGRLLVVTHLGQVLVYDAHRGEVLGSPLDLVTGIDPTDSERGLADCQPARSRCPVAAAPAFSPASDMTVLTLWQPGERAPQLVGLKYQQGASTLTPTWTSDAVTAGPIASPVLSHDGATVYVGGRDDELWAVDAEDGTAKWSVPLEFLPQTPPAVSPDGLVIPGGGPGAHLMGVRDDGDTGEVVWERDDVVPLSSTSLAGPDVAYTVVSEGDGLTLLVFNPGDGRTLNSYPLPEATGWPVSVAVGKDGRVIAATSDGQVYGYRPA